MVLELNIRSCIIKTLHTRSQHIQVGLNLLWIWSWVTINLLQFFPCVTAKSNFSKNAISNTWIEAEVFKLLLKRNIVLLKLDFAHVCMCWLGRSLKWWISQRNIVEREVRNHSLLGIRFRQVYLSAKNVLFLWNDSRHFDWAEVHFQQFQKTKKKATFSFA